MLNDLPKGTEAIQRMLEATSVPQKAKTVMDNAAAELAAKMAAMHEADQHSLGNSNATPEGDSHGVIVEP